VKPSVANSDDIAFELASQEQSLHRWRLYLALHLLVVIATAVAMTASRADYFDRGTWRDVAIPLAPISFPLAVVGFPLAYASPLVIVVLLMRAGDRGSRYALAAVVEFALMFTHFYALMPLVQ
jgi:hypothetical protein